MATALLVDEAVAITPSFNLPHSDGRDTQRSEGSPTKLLCLRFENKRIIMVL